MSVPNGAKFRGFKTQPAKEPGALVNDEGSDPGSHQGGGCQSRKVDPLTFVTWRPGS